jgi:pimeloyl-ACP methyl ester carboxylesterase
MSNIFDTISFLWGGMGAGRPTMRTLGVAAVVAVALGASACASATATTDALDPTTSDAPSSPTSRPSSPPASVATPADRPIVASTVAATTAPRPTGTIDELVGAAGERVHVRCVGEGDTTVVLIAGFGGDSTVWALIEPAIAARARVCSYDRPGTGTSDPATSTATFATQAMDLHDLLGEVGAPGPYVVVGHSFGGAEAVTFASLFADEVTGLVLIDASPTTWPASLCAVPDDGSDGAAMLRGLCGMFAPTGNSEHLDAVAAFAEAAQIGSLGSLPMAVITATHRELPADLATSEVDRLNETWNLGQQAWKALSTTAHLVTVEHTGHHIEIDQPGFVIDEITRLLP